jgi:hypothetical protein
MNFACIAFGAVAVLMLQTTVLRETQISDRARFVPHNTRTALQGMYALGRYMYVRDTRTDRPCVLWADIDTYCMHACVHGPMYLNGPRSVRHSLSHTQTFNTPWLPSAPTDRPPQRVPSLHIYICSPFAFHGWTNSCPSEPGRSYTSRCGVRLAPLADMCTLYIYMYIDSILENILFHIYVHEVSIRQHASLDAG